ncbi:MAG: hypothetical protein A2958_02480 [Candidatus Levybacteria bacterium RIFCSPLOWO2_01_FULL_38_13]|nr:MAG: hypothetical protein A2629_02900 [Candidatus Levybacteria bacterium RIFCSPHIGHO2_01_FULL_41_15]OGH35204.1 MAG: hypothetical protein A2958_02480 [Candidatus Levybacteria bacterium RIFCSPLOWO2_01_FULL_38_13]
MILTLFEKRKEAEGVYSFKFRAEEEFSWKPGQYMFYTLPNLNPDERGVTRYFTISSTPFEKNIMLTTRISSNGSSFKKSLNKMQKEDTIEVAGPDGNFVITSPNRSYIFIAGGIGITPFRSILLDLDYNKLPINVHLLYANRDNNIVFKDEIESLTARNSNFKIQYFISPIRIDEIVLRSLNSELRSPNFFVSGPKLFVQNYSDVLKNIGIEKDRIKLDFFPGYTSE